MTQSRISIWRKDSKSYLYLKKGLKVVSPDNLLFDSLQKQSHKYSLVCWSPAEARSHLFFWRLIPRRSKVLVIPYFYVVWERIQSHIHTLLSACVGERYQSRISPPYLSVCVQKDLKSYPLFTFLFVCEKTQSHIHTLLFSSCVRKNSKLNLRTLFFNNFTS